MAAVKLNQRQQDYKKTNIWEKISGPYLIVVAEGFVTLL